MRIDSQDLNRPIVAIRDDRERWHENLGNVSVERDGLPHVSRRRIEDEQFLGEAHDQFVAEDDGSCTHAAVGPAKVSVPDDGSISCLKRDKPTTRPYIPDTTADDDCVRAPLPGPSDQ